MRPLRVAYDMTFPNRNAAGTGEYARELLRALRGCLDVEMVVVSGPGHSGAARTAAWLLRDAGGAVGRAGADVLHCPAHVTPLRSGVPLVVTVHDLGGRLDGGFPLEWRVFTRLMLPGLARRADRVVTPSEYVRGALVAEWRLDPARVAAVPHGVGDEFAAVAGTARSDRASPPRLLFAGAPVERKNLSLVLGAMAAAAPGSALHEAELLISGAEAGAFPRQAAAVAELGLGDRVRWLGLVPRRDMPALYRSVDALVYPSRYEGFGLPPLEAMATGTPVVAARAACLPETVGDAALLVDPDDPADLGAAVERILGDDELRRTMIAAGRARAAAFTWARSAAATLDVYRAAAGVGGMHALR